MPNPRRRSKKSAKKQKLPQSAQGMPVLQEVKGDGVISKKKYQQPWVSTDEQQLCQAVRAGNYIQFLRIIAAGGNVHARDTTSVAVSGTINYSASSSVETHSGAKHEPQMSIHTYKSNYTLLMLAVFGGYEDIVQFLIDCRVDIDAVDAMSTTALMLAAQQNHIRIAYQLIIAGADLNKMGSQNNTALMLAVQHQHIEMVALLLRAGAKTDLFNQHGSTALHMAAQFGLNDIVSLLLTYKATVDISSPHDKITPLMLAVRENKMDTVKLLVEKGGADLKLKNIGHQNVLHIAKILGHRELLLWLLNLSDQDLINTPTDKKTSLLMLAAYHKDYELVDILLARGADTTLWCEGIGTVMHDAINCEDNQQIVLFASYPCNSVTRIDSYTPLELAVAKNNVYAVTCLLNAGVNPNMTIGQGSSLLAIASYHGSIDIVKQLLIHGADLNYQAPQFKGARAIDLAAQEGHVVVVQHLLELGALHHASGEDKTLLHWAVIGKSTAMISFLLQQGFDVNSRDQSGATPLHLAVAQGYGDLAKLLLEYGADPRAVDSQGISVLQYAKEHRESMISTLLGQLQTLVTTQEAGLFKAAGISTSAPSNQGVPNTLSALSEELSTCLHM